MGASQIEAASMPAAMGFMPADHSTHNLCDTQPDDFYGIKSFCGCLKL
jgi:hypothetical protein